MDSRASRHATHNRGLFTTYTIDNNRRIWSVEDEERGCIKRSSYWEMHFRTSTGVTLVLNVVCHVLDIRLNLILIGSWITKITLISSVQVNKTR